MVAATEPPIAAIPVDPIDDAETPTRLQRLAAFGGRCLRLLGGIVVGVIVLAELAVLAVQLVVKLALPSSRKTVLPPRR